MLFFQSKRCLNRLISKSYDSESLCFSSDLSPFCNQPHYKFSCSDIFLLLLLTFFLFRCLFSTSTSFLLVQTPPKLVGFSDSTKPLFSPNIRAIVFMLDLALSLLSLEDMELRRNSMGLTFFLLTCTTTLSSRSTVI